MHKRSKLIISYFLAYFVSITLLCSQDKTDQPKPDSESKDAAVHSIEDSPKTEIIWYEHPWDYYWGVERPLWSGDVSIGANGSEGNTELFNTRFTADAKRDSVNSIFTSSFLYAKNISNGRETEHKAIADMRKEWKLDASSWSIYAFESTTYDEFQNWDLRIVTGGGLGYFFWKEEKNFFQFRFGGGVSRDIGGLENRFTPEANLALDYAHAINKRHKLTALVEYFPSFLDLSDFRINSKAQWEILIDPEWNMTLKLGVADRYQTQASGAKNNDIDYFATIGWKY